jgi:hypothetical protein
MAEQPERRESERRNAGRQKSFLRGVIYYNNRRNAVDCLVRDISQTGARLILSDAVSIPDVVDLFIPQKDQTLRSQVHWRHGQEIGVAFAQSGTAAQPADGELAALVAKLEVEIAALKRMLKRLKADVDGPDTDVA